MSSADMGRRGAPRDTGTDVPTYRICLLPGDGHRPGDRRAGREAARRGGRGVRRALPVRGAPHRRLRHRRDARGRSHGHGAARGGPWPPRVPATRCCSPRWVAPSGTTPRRASRAPSRAARHPQGARPLSQPASRARLRRPAQREPPAPPSAWRAWICSSCASSRAASTSARTSAARASRAPAWAARPARPAATSWTTASARSSGSCAGRSRLRRGVHAGACIRWTRPTCWRTSRLWREVTHAWRLTSRRSRRPTCSWTTAPCSSWQTPPSLTCS